MSNPRWSYSRFGTLDMCPISYKNKYEKEFVVVGKGNELATKGLSFHEIAEWMDSTKDLDELYAYAQAKLELMKIDQEKYPVLKSIPRFYAWWQDYVKIFENKGFILEREKWMNFKLPGVDAPVVGAMDVVLINPKTKFVRIYDYKTAKSANADSYKKQLLLYSYAIGKSLNMNFEEMQRKISCYVFFPMFNVKDEESEDASKCLKNMLKAMKEIVVTAEDISSTIDDLCAKYKKACDTDWDSVTDADGTPGFYCSFCDFLAAPTLPDIGFTGCKCTREQGFLWKRSWKIMTKAEMKALKT
jgi:hypothetical protein